ncbi:hypothetical protein E4U43_007783 [Claviceps pusilla]|uniref:Uncharacterized protein n=1 Tax=Claviceps pusilla TaxID=123648 RepID=A0A9P7NDY0_9HYPO|nr:hypothetical protein E4U43_007783 [Claviceps pusilla]
MPRRTSVDMKGMHDAPSLDNKGARKTERSHEENQERAYIAASRRADRSIEARVQSARMASEIHKKRTGKGFRITEEIVLKEEMYEEEDDDLPRSYRLLSASMQTPNLEMNSRLDAYLTNKVAMSQMLARTNDEWRENEVNRLFAASFPNALPTTSTTSQQQQLPPQPLANQTLDYQQQQQQQQQPLSEAFSPKTSPTAAVPPSSYSASFSGALPSSTSSPQLPSSPSLLQQRQHSLGSLQWPPRSKSSSRRKSRTSESGVKSRRNSSKPSLTLAKKKSLDNSTTTTHTTPVLDNAISPHSLYEPSTYPTTSAFTTELPAEARMMLDGTGDDAVMEHTFANLDQGYFPDWLTPENLFDNASFPRTDPMFGVQESGFMTMTDVHGSVAEESIGPKCAMPVSQNAFDGLEWRNFINDSMWNNDQ